VVSRSQSILGVSVVNPLVAFYDIYGRKGDVLFFYFVSDTTRDLLSVDFNFIKCMHQMLTHLPLLALLLLTYKHKTQLD
jgi:hypothetical protein